MPAPAATWNDGLCARYGIDELGLTLNASALNGLLGLHTGVHQPLYWPRQHHECTQQAEEETASTHEWEIAMAVTDTALELSDKPLPAVGQQRFR